MINKAICFSILASLFWSIAFVVPIFLPNLGCIDLVLGRYLFYGFFSLLLFSASLALNFNRICLNYWKQAILIASILMFGYTTFLWGLKNCNPTVVALILSLSPMTIALVSFDQKRPFLLLSIGILLGFILMHWVSLQKEWHSFSPFQYTGGFLSGLVSLITWTWYVIFNARFLKNHPVIHPLQWTLLIGSITFGYAILGMCLRGALNEWVLSISFYDLLMMVILGILSTGLGFFFWNYSSKYLSPALLAQLAILESVFALILIYAIQEKMPPMMEISGILVILFAIFWGIKNQYTVKG